MRNTMSVTNLEYASLKKRGGLYNWGFVNREQNLNATEANNNPAKSTEYKTHPHLEADDSNAPQQTP